MTSPYGFNPNARQDAEQQIVDAQQRIIQERQRQNAERKQIIQEAGVHIEAILKDFAENEPVRGRVTSARIDTLPRASDQDMEAEIQGASWSLVTDGDQKGSFDFVIVHLSVNPITSPRLTVEWHPSANPTKENADRLLSVVKEVTGYPAKLGFPTP
jgi:hypothetical protein